MPSNATHFMKIPVGQKFWNIYLGELIMFRKIAENQAILINSIVQNMVIPIYQEPKLICVPLS